LPGLSFICGAEDFFFVSLGGGITTGAAGVGFTAEAAGLGCKSVWLDWRLMFLAMIFYFLNTQQMIARLKTKAAFVGDGSFQEDRHTLRGTDAYPHAHAHSV